MIAIVGENMTVELPDDMVIQVELKSRRSIYQVSYPPSKPNLGLATTAQLLDEIRSRIEIDYFAGGGGLGYTTVGGRAS